MRLCVIPEDKGNKEEIWKATRWVLHTRSRPNGVRSCSGHSRGQPAPPPPTGPLTLNLSVTPSVMLTVNSAILGGRALPFLRSGSYSVFVFTTTLSRKQRSRVSGTARSPQTHQPGEDGHGNRGGRAPVMPASVSQKGEQPPFAGNLGTRTCGETAHE